ncbi:hypothetical protein [Alicyclobacillus mengziensis]|uniref:Uncharacterized protein n=1 Tax=Alicyclobacillus mengziensis TaxID=2931921 RepID=A0A9X7VXB3_9BACL|nr:hypothetical protein [Alicyclobacillus mengziensis]QSO46349.1 hypothetical protein JZ786_17895 [Alicyclobacillus mengziensis]
MSFRGTFIQRINDLYQDTAIRRKSIEMDWRRIQGYFRSFIEEIHEVQDFACASVSDSESELVLAVEGKELAFRKRDNVIQVVTNGRHHDFLHPTIEGFCVNYEDKKVLEVIDDYMRVAFQSALEEMD